MLGQQPLTQLLSLRAFAPFLSRGMAGMSKEVVTGLNVLKKGQDPPLRPDAELPEWLWQLAEPEKTLNELRRSKQEDLPLGTLERFVKLENRDNIRTRNRDRAK